MPHPARTPARQQQSNLRPRRSSANPTAWDDDDDLLVAADTMGPTSQSDDATPPPPTPTKRGIWVGTTAVATLVVATLLATVGSPRPAQDETVHHNWAAHVEALTSHNSQLQQQGQSPDVKFVNHGGVALLQKSVSFDESDRDRHTTQSVRTALQQGDLAAATAALQSAQQIEPVEDAAGQPLPVQKPEISAGLRDAILQGDTDFFHIYLFDSCDEDGDIVEVLINGEPFAIVPITHAGATLSVPVGTGNTTTIALRGVRDGVGGITVACRTSQGDFFMSCMAEGEVQPIGLVR